ncbi:hypothetical protein SGPA1_11127 [Streptomyces misionensis JCM 4497]
MCTGRAFSGAARFSRSGRRRGSAGCRSAGSARRMPGSGAAWAPRRVAAGRRQADTARAPGSVFQSFGLRADPDPHGGREPRCAAAAAAAAVAAADLGPRARGARGAAAVPDGAGGARRAAAR